MKIVKKILLILLVALVLLQFYRPEKNSAELREVAAFETETKVKADIAEILEKHCYDCHSDKTTYPWYGQIAPVSLWLDHHVEEGKEHFDVSNWKAYSVKKKDHKLDELIEEVEEGKMPLDSYTWVHGTMSDAEKEALISWAKNARKAYDAELRNGN